MKISYRKLKTRFKSVEATQSTALIDGKTQNLSSGPSTGWDGFKMALAILKEVSSTVPALQSLQASVGGLLKVLDSVDAVSAEQEMFETMIQRVGRFSRELGQYKASSPPEDVQISVDALIQSIERRKQFIESRMSKNLVGRVLNASDDADDILNSLRELSYAVDLFQVNRLVDIYQIEGTTTKTVKAASQAHKTTKLVESPYRHELLKRLDPVDGARYDESHRTGCIPGTRLDILAKLLAWAVDLNSPSTYWLSGMAGIGKTAIAHSFCQLIDDGRLGANFFCSRQSHNLNDVTRIFPTVAYQLANRLPPYREALIEVLKNAAPSSLMSSPLQQVQYLFIDIKDKLRVGSPLVVVVDALDECTSASTVSDFLRILARSGLPLKFLITSRPEATFESVFASEEVVKFRLQDIEGDAVEQDITRYLTHELSSLLEPVYKKDTQKMIHALAERSGNHFIFASTAVQHIKALQNRTSSRDVQRRLSTVLSPASSQTVDNLYNQIFVSAYHNEREEFRAPLDVLLCFRVPQSITVISALLNKPPDEVRLRLQKFSSVLHIPDNDQDPVFPYDASFSEYVMDHQRSGNYALDTRDQDNRLALACLKLLNSLLGKDLCNIKRREIQNADVSKSNVQARISPPLRYASLYWASHLPAGVRADTQVFAELQIFVDVHLLHWLECLSLIQELHVAYGCIQKAHLHLMQYSAPAGADYQETRTILLDAQYMIPQVYHFLRLHALEVYVSAIAWLPSESMLRAKYMKEKEERGEKTRVLRGLDPHWDACLQILRSTRHVFCVAFSPSGINLACGTGTTVQIWNLEIGQLVATLIGHSDYVTSIAISPDGSRLASGSDDRTVQIWIIDTGELHSQLSGHTGHVTCVAFSPDGSKLTSGSDDKTVRIWSADTGELVQRLSGHTGSISSVAFSPDQAKLVSASHDRTVRIWDTETGQFVQKLAGHTSLVSSVAFSPDGSKLVSASRDKAVQVWNSDTGELIQKLQGHTSAVTSVAFSPDGSKFITGSHDKTVHVWNSNTGELLEVLSGHTDLVTSVAFSPEGSRIASGSRDATVRVWDAHSTIHNENKVVNHASLVTVVAFSPDESRVASGSSDGAVHIWSASTGELVRELSLLNSEVTSLSFSPDGTKCVSGSYNAAVRVCNVDTGELIMELHGHERSIRSVAYSPDGTKLASGSDDRTVMIWNANTGEIIERLRGFTHRIIYVGFSSDGSKLVFGSEDGMNRVWDTDTGMLVEELEEDRGISGVGPVAYPAALWADVVIGARPSSDLRFWSVQKPARGQCRLVLRDSSSMQVQSQLWIWGPKNLLTVSASSFSGRKACLGYLTGEIVILELPDD